MRLETFCTVPHRMRFAQLLAELDLAAVAFADRRAGVDLGLDFLGDLHRIAPGRLQLGAQDVLEHGEAARLVGRGLLESC